MHDLTCSFNIRVPGRTVRFSSFECQYLTGASSLKEIVLRIYAQLFSIISKQSESDTRERTCVRVRADASM